jgi:hypothetical protein
MRRSRCVCFWVYTGRRSAQLRAEPAETWWRLTEGRALIFGPREYSISRPQGNPSAARACWAGGER